MIDKIDIPALGVSVVLISVIIVLFFFGDQIEPFILAALESNISYFIVWGFLMVICIIHYQKHKGTAGNMISDNEGMEKPIDYLLFIVTHGTIGTAVITLASQIAPVYLGSSSSNCQPFSKFDVTTFSLVAGMLIFYSYGKVAPIFQETYLKKSAIEPKKIVL